VIVELARLDLLETLACLTYVCVIMVGMFESVAVLLADYARLIRQAAKPKKRVAEQPK
jgi:hypothetical protein